MQSLEKEMADCYFNLFQEAMAIHMVDMGVMADMEDTGAMVAMEEVLVIQLAAMEEVSDIQLVVSDMVATGELDDSASLHTDSIKIYLCTYLSRYN